MSELLNLRYRFDPTGQANSNLIVDEVHNLTASGARILIANEGVFYTTNFSIRPTSSSTPLTLNIDYHYISMDTEVTARTGLETATGIELMNDTLIGDFSITYQCVGGVEGRSNALVANLIEAIETSKDAPVDWNKLLNIPAQFPPEWHPHEVTDLNGLEAVTAALGNLERAIYDSRPLQLSGSNLHWQDERILNLISIMMDRINAIYALVAGLSVQSIVDDALADAEAEYNRKLQILIDAIDWGAGGPPNFDPVDPDPDPDPDPETELYPGLNVYDAGGISGPSALIPGSVSEPDIVDVGVQSAPEVYPGLNVYDAGTILGPTPSIPGSVVEPDIVDLNPGP